MSAKCQRAGISQQPEGAWGGGGGARRGGACVGQQVGTTHVVEMRELDFDGRRQQSRSGLDNHRHHLRVEEGAVAMETKRISAADDTVS